MRTLKRCVTRAHLEVPFAFAHEPIYFEIIKSAAGIRWCRLVRERQGAAREAPLWAIWWSLVSQEQIKCNNRRQMQKRPCPHSHNRYPGLPPHSSYWFFFNDMHKKVISLSLYCQWWLIRFSWNSRSHIPAKRYRYWSSKWDRHLPTACTAAIWLSTQVWNTNLATPAPCPWFEF